MAVPKKLVRLAGDDVNLKVGNNPAQQPNPMALAIAVAQLQDTVNEIITRFNAHTHGGGTVGAGTTAVPGVLVQGTAVTATNLFVAAAA